jgi:hypothetical protein
VQFPDSSCVSGGDRGACPCGGGLASELCVRNRELRGQARAHTRRPGISRALPVASACSWFPERVFRHRSGWRVEYRLYFNPRPRGRVSVRDQSSQFAPRARRQGPHREPPRCRSIPAGRSASPAPTAAASPACSRCCATSSTPRQGDLDMPPGWVIAHVAQETPGLAQPAIDYVLDGDAELRRIEAELVAAEDAHDGSHIGELHARLHEIGGYAARARAAALLDGLGFLQGRHRAPGGGLLRRLADAPEPRAGADVPLRPAAARRADQPPRPRRGDLARGLAARLPRHAAADLARPRLPRRRRHPYRPHRARKLALYTGNYSAFERQRGEQPRAAAGDVREAAARHRASSRLHRPLPRQGHQGAPGAEPDQGARAHGAHRRRPRRHALQLRLPRCAAGARSAAADRGRARWATATPPCWSASR